MGYGHGYLGAPKNENACCNLFNRITVGFQRWKKTRFPTPGAENCAYDTLTLPMQYFINNSNYAVMGQLMVIGPEPFIMGQQVIPTGLAGIVSGQLVSQPLQGSQGS